MGNISKSIGEWLSDFLIQFVGNRWPWLTSDPELLAMITGFALGAFFTWCVYWLVHRGKINGLNATVRGLEADNRGIERELKIMERQKTELENKLKEFSEQENAALPIPSPLLSSGIFRIEKYYSKLHWNEQGKTELRPFHPDITVPNHATLTLEVQARITATPARHVKNIELELLGHSPLTCLEEEWPKIMSPQAIILLFRIPSFIPNGEYLATLIATIKERDTDVKMKSPPFDIILTRSYNDLSKMSY